MNLEITRKKTLSQQSVLRTLRAEQRRSYDQTHDLSKCGHLIASFAGDLAHIPSRPANCARLQSPALLTSRLQNVLVIVNYQGLIQSQCPIIRASLSDS